MPKPFEKGNPGRVKGSQNKLTKTVKETVLAVFNDLQTDPKANLTAWAKKEPTEFYKIASKLIPTEVQATVDATIVWNETTINGSDEETITGAEVFTGPDDN